MAGKASGGATMIKLDKLCQTVVTVAERGAALTPGVEVHILGYLSGAGEKIVLAKENNGAQVVFIKVMFVTATELATTGIGLRDNHHTVNAPFDFAGAIGLGNLFNRSQVERGLVFTAVTGVAVDTFVAIAAGAISEGGGVAALLITPYLFSSSY